MEVFENHHRRAAITQMLREGLTEQDLKEGGAMGIPREEHCSQKSRCKYPEVEVCLMYQKKSMEATRLEHSGQGEWLHVWSEVTWTLE